MRQIIPHIKLILFLIIISSLIFCFFLLVELFINIVFFSNIFHPSRLPSSSPIIYPTTSPIIAHMLEIIIFIPSHSSPRHNLGRNSFQHLHNQFQGTHRIQNIYTHFDNYQATAQSSAVV